MTLKQFFSRQVYNSVELAEYNYWTTMRKLCDWGLEDIAALLFIADYEDGLLTQKQFHYNIDREEI